MLTGKIKASTKLKTTGIPTTKSRAIFHHQRIKKREASGSDAQPNEKQNVCTIHVL